MRPFAVQLNEKQKLHVLLFHFYLLLLLWCYFIIQSASSVKSCFKGICIQVIGSSSNIKKNIVLFDVYFLHTVPKFELKKTIINTVSNIYISYISLVQSLLVADRAHIPETKLQESLMSTHEVTEEPFR